MASRKAIDEALTNIREYSGMNPFLLQLRKKLIICGHSDKITDFEVEYINLNVTTEPKVINKIVGIVDWYGKAKKEEWGTDFVPSKLKIISYLGQTKTAWHCVIQYRQSVPPFADFIPKKALLDDFLVTDYRQMSVDFGRYDRISTQKDPHRILRSHQKDAVKFLLNRKKCILADAPGVGKTTELAVAAIEGNFDAVLIICPASLKSTWLNELLWYIPQRDISVIDSPQGKKKNDLEEMLGYGIGKSGKKAAELLEEAKELGKWRDNRVVIINYDILEDVYKIPSGYSVAAQKKALEQSPLLKYLNRGKALIIIDEAHKLANSTSGRFKLIKDMVKRSNPDSLYLSTGTPITNNPVNLFNLLLLINHPVADDYQYYAERYCDAFKMPAKGQKEKWQTIYCRQAHKNIASMTESEKQDMKKFVREHARMITISNGASNLDELKQRVSSVYLRRVKEDLADVVKKTIHECIYYLTPEQKAEYDKLWEEYEQEKLNEDPDKELNKSLLEGGLYRRYLAVEMVPRTEALADSILANGEKVVIMCCYDNELYALRDYYGDRAVIYNGKMSASEKDASYKAFQTNPEVKVFIGNTVAAGVGISLTAAKKLIFNNLPFTSSDVRQCSDRVHRLSSKEDVDIYIQYFAHTEYQHVWEIVMRKEFITDSVIKTENEKKNK